MNDIEREKTKERMFEQRLERDRVHAKAREERDNRWLNKTKANPLAVNLVAEEERIYEETQLRTKLEDTRKYVIKEQKTKVKNEIILKVRFSSRYYFKCDLLTF